MVEAVRGISEADLDRALKSTFNWNLPHTGVGHMVDGKAATAFDVVDAHRSRLNSREIRRSPDRRTDDLVSHLDALRDLCETHKVQLYGAMEMAALWGARYGVSEHETPLSYTVSKERP